MMNSSEEPAGIHILLVDDDARLQAAAKDFFEPYGYVLTGRPDGSDIEQAVETLMPDIILLDVMMPGDDGFVVLRRLRAATSTPVIMLTARGRDADRISGLELGADDYVPKPFNPRELLARIRAVLRRSARTEEDGEVSSGSLSVGTFTLDIARQKLKRRGRATDLTATEFRVVRAFMRRAGDVLSREELHALAFGEQHCCSDRNIDVYVSRVRSTLRTLCGSDSPIRTVWGAGYCWIKDD